jgi:hypothetical protein
MNTCVTTKNVLI